jgi:hypothetical protein
MGARFVEFEGADGDVTVNVSNVQWVEKGTKDLTGDHTAMGTVEQVTKKLNYFT